MDRIFVSNVVAESVNIFFRIYFHKCCGLCARSFWFLYYCPPIVSANFLLFRQPYDQHINRLIFTAIVHRFVIADRDRREKTDAHVEEMHSLELLSLYFLVFTLVVRFIFFALVFSDCCSCGGRRYFRFSFACSNKEGSLSAKPRPLLQLQKS